MEMLDDQYWLKYAKSSVENSISSRNQAAAKLEKMTLLNLTTANDVYQCIQEVIELQSKYCLSTLYKQQWRERSEDNNDMNTDKKKKGVNDEKDDNHKSCKGWHEKLSSSTYTFTIAQFNALAEGLSSCSLSPTMLSPHHPKHFLVVTMEDL